MRSRSLLTGLLFCCCVVPELTGFPQISLTRFAGGLQNPTAIVSANDGSGRLFVLEQRGRIRILQNGTLQEAPFLDISGRVSCCGERGLLGLAFPPGYSSKRYFYINYTNRDGDTVISRVNTLPDPGAADPQTENVLLTIAQPFSNHNGGHLLFNTRDGYLYVGTGDGGSSGDPQRNAQNPESLLGKMLRIDVEAGRTPYAIPPDNPFVGRSGYRPEIWALGLRNPWRYSFDRATGDLWTGDVGQNRAEEINFRPASSRGGENYGWNSMEGLGCYPPQAICNPNQFTLPILEYTRDLGISVTGGMVYRGQRFPALHGVYLYADYGSGNIWGVRRTCSGWENRLLLRSGRNISTFGEDEAGELYVTDHSEGEILLINAAPDPISATCGVNAASFEPGISPGSIITVFGAGISSAPGIAEAESVPLPNEIAGASVTVNGQRVPLFAVASVNGQEQVSFQAPFNLPGTDRASVVVNLGGRSTTAVEVPVRAAQPGVFGMPNGYGAILDSAWRLVDSQNRIEKGQPVSIYATGLGAVSNTPEPGVPASGERLSLTQTAPAVMIGGVEAPVGFSGLAPGFVGLYQINVTVPANIPSGDVDLVVTTGGVSSNAVKIAVR